MHKIIPHNVVIYVSCVCLSWREYVPCLKQYARLYLVHVVGRCCSYCWLVLVVTYAVVSCSSLVVCRLSIIPSCTSTVSYHSPRSSARLSSPRQRAHFLSEPFSPVGRGAACRRPRICTPRAGGCPLYPGHRGRCSAPPRDPAPLQTPSPSPRFDMPRLSSFSFTDQPSCCVIRALFALSPDVLSLRRTRPRFLLFLYFLLSVLMFSLYYTSQPLLVRNNASQRVCLRTG